MSCWKYWSITGKEHFSYYIITYYHILFRPLYARKYREFSSCVVVFCPAYFLLENRYSDIQTCFRYRSVRSSFLTKTKLDLEQWWVSEWCLTCFLAASKTYYLARESQNLHTNHHTVYAWMYVRVCVSVLLIDLKDKKAARRMRMRWMGDRFLCSSLVSS